MKKFIVLCTILFSASAGIYAQQTETLPSDVNDQVSGSGVMTLKAEVWTIRVSDMGSDIDYIPSNLDEPFKQEGLKVQFSGITEQVPANVRMSGRPIKLTSIVKL